MHIIFFQGVFMKWSKGAKAFFKSLLGSLGLSDAQRQAAEAEVDKIEEEGDPTVPAVQPAVLPAVGTNQDIAKAVAEAVKSATEPMLAILAKQEEDKKKQEEIVKRQVLQKADDDAKAALKKYIEEGRIPADNKEKHEKFLKMLKETPDVAKAAIEEIPVAKRSNGTNGQDTKKADGQGGVQAPSKSAEIMMGALRQENQSKVVFNS